MDEAHEGPKAVPRHRTDEEETGNSALEIGREERFVFNGADASERFGRQEFQLPQVYSVPCRGNNMIDSDFTLHSVNGR